MEEYDQRILTYVDLLVQHIENARTKNTSLNVNDIMFWFCWDVMGDTTFGQSFRMLQDEKFHKVVTLLKRALKILGPATPAPWLFHVAFYFIPSYSVVRDFNEMKQYCKVQMEDRMKVCRYLSGRPAKDRSTVC